MNISKVLGTLKTMTVAPALRTENSNDDVVIFWNNNNNYINEKLFHLFSF